MPPLRNFMACALAGALLLAAGCTDVDNRPHAWGYISPIILQPNCATASCHSRETAVAGLDLSTPDRGYQSLMAQEVLVATSGGSPAAGCQQVGATTFCPRARPLVTPYDPDQSRLVNMLRARGAPRMPPDRPLPEPDITLIENWILDGARQSSSAPSTSSGSSSTDGGHG